jgi:hypothetical protein
MNGILIDAESGDLLVQHSSVVIGDTDSQIAEGVLVSMRGEWRSDEDAGRPCGCDVARRGQEDAGSLRS